MIGSLLPAALGAQAFRARIDASTQRVTYRGLVADSIARALAVDDGSGSYFSPDGFRLRCSTDSQCYFFRPGALIRAMPAMASGALTAWGFGVPGLSLRASGRVATDFGADEAVPTIGPFAQLLEGYLEFQRKDLRLRGGRQLIASRLEPIGFDGAAASMRFPDRAAEVGAYAGWGLDRASILPVTDPALDPLDEWRPRRRQVVAGLEGAWSHRYLDLRAEYRREVDPEDHHFVSERSTVSATGNWRDLRTTAGVDYNHVEGRFGSSDLTVTYVRREHALSAGVRRYRPYFSLWTLWGAFSPVGYDAQFATAQVAATPWFSLRGRAEHFAFDDAEISTGLVPALRDDGWRLSAGASARLPRHVTIDGSVTLDRGPGASSHSAELGVDLAPIERVALSLHAGVLHRPLELRYFDAADRWLGARVEWAMRDDRRLWAEVSTIGQERRRPDAGGTRYDQVRLRAGIALTLGNSADRAPLPPAVRPMR